MHPTLSRSVSRQTLSTHLLWSSPKPRTFWSYTKIVERKQLHKWILVTWARCSKFRKNNLWTPLDHHTSHSSYFILFIQYDLWFKINISLILLYQCEKLQKSWLISFSHFTLPFSISRHSWATSFKILISSSLLNSSELQLPLCLGNFQNESTYY